MSRERKFIYSLDESERKIIKKIFKTTNSSNKRTRCNILLTADQSNGKNRTYTEISNIVGCSKTTVITTIKQYCTEGLNKALTPKRNPNSDVANLKATGDVQAHVIAKACGNPPQGYARWTLTLLQQEMMVVLEITLSRSTIGRILKNNDLRPHLSEYWCIPPEADAEFVATMEDILDVYQQPYDPKRPLWCMDEKPYQLLGENRQPIPMRPGDIAKIDSEYERNGTASIFCFIQPHTGEIFHFVEPTRTAVDWAEKIKHLGTVAK